VGSSSFYEGAPEPERRLVCGARGARATRGRAAQGEARGPGEENAGAAAGGQEEQEEEQGSDLGQATAANALATAQTAECAFGRAAAQQRLANGSLEAGALALAQQQRAVAEAALDTASLLEANGGLLALEKAALVRWFQGSRGRRRAFGLLKLAVVRSRQRAAFAARAAARRVARRLRAVLAAWRALGRAGAVGRGATAARRRRAAAAALDAWRVQTTLGQTLRARAAAVGAASGARRQRRALEAWAAAGWRRRLRRRSTGRRVALACAVARCAR
jgi:hypothetical protein